VYTVSAPRIGSLRLSRPSAHSGLRSPLFQGLPRPVGSAFRVFVYPLSGLLLQKSSEPSFRLKRSWGSLLQSFAPLKDRFLSRGPLLSCPLLRNLRPPIVSAGRPVCSQLDSRVFLPLRSRVLQVAVTRSEGTDTLLEFYTCEVFLPGPV
jgi:hypothetical protein